MGRASASGAVAFLEFLATATGAGVVAADILQRVACRFGRTMIAVRAVHVAVIMVMVVIMVAIRAVNMGLLVHGGYSGM